MSLNFYFAQFFFVKLTATTAECKIFGAQQMLQMLAQQMRRLLADYAFTIIRGNLANFCFAFCQFLKHLNSSHSSCCCCCWMPDSCWRLPHCFAFCSKNLRVDKNGIKNSCIVFVSFFSINFVSTSTSKMQVFYLANRRTVSQSVRHCEVLCGVNRNVFNVYTHSAVSKKQDKNVNELNVNFVACCMQHLLLAAC